MVTEGKRISRRRFCQNSLGAIAATEIPITGFTRTLLGEEPLKGKPNILFIFSDQQRWDSVDCYGSPLFKGLTPNLDKLAARLIERMIAIGEPRPIIRGRWRRELYSKFPIKR